ncbi:MAG: toll/interleukin-1 receptor domain-containing protein, partial [Bacteroidaceae bacterium]|nr:toll/interleukin-1 receptor domain-containing protein [Bacteroidaceae bacterium]
MKNHKGYYAFISYKREDEKWAKWLQRKLENYKLPAVIRKENTDIPKYIRPVFRDKTDLGGGVLSEQLRSELLNSKFLIAVCSPHATESEWVNKEVQTFIDEGRAEQIVPFIVDGIPHADNPQEECFPKALLELPQEKELLGINVQEVGKEMAVVRLVATLLGLRFDTLWQRHRRRVVHRRINVGVIALLLFLIGLFVWDYNRPTYACFADYVDRYGVPEGVIPLTDEQVEKRTRCFLFEFRRIPFGEPNAYKWRVNKVSYVNSALRPQEVTITEWKDRYPIMQMEYNEETGVASRINFCDVKGKVLLRHVLSERNGVPAAVADFIASREQQGTGFVGASLSSLSMGEMASGQNKASIVRYVYERNADGYIVRQTYHSNNDYQLSRSAVSDADGIFGKQYTLDSLGRRIRVEYLGFEGEKACTKKGVAGCSYVYEPHGNIQKTIYFNLQDSLVLNELMYAISVCEVNSDGNVIEACYFDTDDNPCLSNQGYAKWTCKYDVRGNQIAVCYFDTDDNPCLSNQGYAKWTCKYDVRGNQIEVCYFDTDDNPCLSNQGYAKWTCKYDVRGNQIEACYFDTDDNLCLSNQGYAKWTCKYDDRGNQIENCFFDAEGHLCLINEGYAQRTAKYDNRGNRIEVRYFDTDGNPCLSNDGYAKWTCKYDVRGNQIEACYFDTDDNPCLSNDGYAK